MKRKSLQKLREKGIEELKKKVLAMKKEQVELVAKIAVGREKNLKSTKNLRRDIAQLLTLIREKELLEQKTNL